MAEIRHYQGYGALSDLPCWELIIGNSKAVVSSYGAHVFCYQVGSEPVLWLSETAVWQNGKAIRGGIPICWPWFGACPTELNSDNSTKPNHGLARTQFWTVTEQVVADSEVQISFELKKLQLPWALELVDVKYLVELTEDSLTVTLSSEQLIAQQAALHSYFKVENSAESEVSPLPYEYYDKTTDSMEIADSETCRFPAEIDRVYANTGELLKLFGPSKPLIIRQNGHDASIVWNPGFTKASQATDIAPNSWQQFVCVESASLSLLPSRLCLSQQIKNPFA